MRERNKYTLPLSAGVDPQGWTAGLRHYVDDRYRLVTSTTFDNALRSAVKRMRLTNLPVALTVAHGNHGWILTGFAATEDPARTASFEVTSVRIVGPLYGLQSRNGYDMRPNTKLTPTQLKRYFTPWKYAPKAMIWDGRYVSIQPIPATTSAASNGSAAAAAPSSAPAAPPAEPSGRTAEGPGAAGVEPPVATPMTKTGPDAGAASPRSRGLPDAAALLLIACAAAAIGLLARMAQLAGRPRGGLRAPG
jgi:hypothetical protein